MSVVESTGELVAVDRPWSPMIGPGGVRLYGDLTQDYASIWRTQPAVRTVTSFLARNVAQVGLPVFRRLSDTDRERLTDHGMARTISRPNPWTTRYRLFHSLVLDKCIFDRALWVKFRNDDPLLGRQVALVRIAPSKWKPIGDDWMTPAGFTVTGSRGSITLPAESVVYFRGYSPDSDWQGTSPMETMRQMLAEEVASASYREKLWRNGARMEHVITRPSDAPKMSPEAKDRFWARWNAQYVGDANSAKTALLEEGMDIKSMSFSARDAQYLEVKKFNLEEAARMYHVQAPMVGILDHATFSNITELHKMLYQDTLGPTFVEVEEDLELQLLPEYDDTDRVYTEFNINEKLKGSFEEQAKSMQTAVGRPWMTADEARARANLPSLGGDAERLVTPLNVLVGGQASPSDSAPPPKALRRGGKASPPADTAPTHVAKHEEVLAAYFTSQREAHAAGDALDPDAWDPVLAEKLYALSAQLTDEVAGAVAETFGGEYDPDRTLNFLLASAGARASNINATTLEQLAEALDADDPTVAVQELFDGYEETRAGLLAAAAVNTIGNFATVEGAKQSGVATKTWTVTSATPRPEHALVDGETVGIDDVFSNGLRWPHDSGGSAEQVAGCTCTVDFNTEDT
jgi:HK97 family phage portal protein